MKTKWYNTEAALTCDVKEAKHIKRGPTIKEQYTQIHDGLEQFVSIAEENMAELTEKLDEFKESEVEVSEGETLEEATEKRQKLIAKVEEEISSINELITKSKNAKTQRELTDTDITILNAVKEDLNANRARESRTV